MKKRIIAFMVLVSLAQPISAGIMCERMKVNGWQHSPGLTYGCLMELIAEMWDSMWSADGDDLAGGPEQG